MDLLSIRDYIFGASDVYSFGVDDGDGKYGMGPKTTHLTHQKVYCWIYGGYFVSSRSRDY